VLNIGLTGNVASGKSTVARHFAAWGATLLDADALVREVQRPGFPVAQAIEDRFGPDVLRLNGTLDRARLRTIVLHDAHARQELNAIVHPAVQARRAQLLAEARGRGDLIVVNDVPLLFEVLDPHVFDLIVLVDAPPNVRLERLTRMRGLPSAEAARLMAAQLPSEEKRLRSHAVIDNVGTLDELATATRAVWNDIRRRAAADASIPGASVLLVIAHPEDAAVLVPGTLHRCADAGVGVHVVCATAGAWPATLPAGSVTDLGVPRGAVAEDDLDGATRIAERLAAIHPQAVITFGPDGLNGHPDHVTVHRWTRSAMADRTDAPRLYYMRSSQPPPTAADHPDPVTTALDVRPWLSTASAGATPCGLGAVAPGELGPWRGREWFDSDPPTGRAQWDLLPPENAG